MHALRMAFVITAWQWLCILIALPVLLWCAPRWTPCRTAPWPVLCWRSTRPCSWRRRTACRPCATASGRSARSCAHAPTRNRTSSWRRLTTTLCVSRQRRVRRKRRRRRRRRTTTCRRSCRLSRACSSCQESRPWRWVWHAHHMLPANTVSRLTYRTVQAWISCA